MKSPTAIKPGTPSAGAPTSTAASAPTITSAASPAVTQATATSGLVLGLDGKPAANVKIAATIVSNDGSTIVAQGGGNLISQDGGGIVAQGGGNALSRPAARRVLDMAALSAVTDATGHFSLALPAGQHANIEAQLDADVKAIALDATSTAGLTLKLDYVGQLTGHVVAPTGSGVTDLTGVDVYIPGTSYGAKTDAGGAFTISGVPAATYKQLLATKDVLGKAQAANVAVTPKGITKVQDMQLVTNVPQIDAFDPPVGTPGKSLAIKGANFGQAQGASLQVTVNGIQVASPTRKSNGEIDVQLPSNAVSGPVVVTAGQVSSPARQLSVFASLFDASATHVVGVKDSIVLHLDALDGGGKLVTGVPVTWAVSGAGATIDAQGKLTGVQAGDVTVTATAGAVSLDLKIAVVAAPYLNTLAGKHEQVLGQPTAPTNGGGQGLDVDMDAPGGIVVAPDGTVFVSDAGEHVIRRFSADGTATLLAGTLGEGAPLVFGGTTNRNFTGAGYADGTGNAAKFQNPAGLALDASGNLLVADAGNDCIRMVSKDGVVTTIAGASWSNAEHISNTRFQDGAASTALFTNPSSVAVDPQGNIIIADSGNNLIRKLDVTTHQVTTLWGKTPPDQSPDFEGAQGLCFDKAGNLYFCESKVVWKLTPTGAATVIAGSTSLTPAGGGEPIAPGFYGYDGHGTDAIFELPNGLAMAADGTLYVLDRGAATSVLRKIDTGLNVTHLTSVPGAGAPATQDGPLASAALAAATGGVALGPDGVLYIPDEGGQGGAIREVHLGTARP